MENTCRHTALAIAAAREDSQDKDFGFGMSLSDEIHDGLRAISNLLGAMNATEVAVIRVVRTDEQHSHLRRWRELELAVEEIPENVLCAKSIMPKIDGMSWRIMTIPDGFQRLVDRARHLSDRMSNGIADQNEVIPAGLHFGHLLRMARARFVRGKISVTWHGRRRPRCGSTRHQKQCSNEGQDEMHG